MEWLFSIVSVQLHTVALITFNVLTLWSGCYTVLFQVFRKMSSASLNLHLPALVVQVGRRGQGFQVCQVHRLFLEVQNFPD